MKNNTNEIYHSDHLGSSSYITDNFGRPSHYYEYLPFGELMTEHNQSKYYLEPYPTQNMSEYNNPYKFNGKEMDRETGMYYYGARYYDPRISIFISVDPLAEEFPNYGGDVYTMNNPINLIDPTGMAPEDWIFYFAGGKYIGMIDTGKGSAIRFNIGGKESSLNPRSTNNKFFFTTVSKYASNKINPALNASYKITPEGSTTGGYHEANTNNITFTDRTFMYNNYYDVLSTAEHENFHDKFGKVSNFKDHANVYIEQAKSDTFQNTSSEYKRSHAGATVQRLLNAYVNDEIDFKTLKKTASKYNSLNPDNKISWNRMKRSDPKNETLDVGSKTYEYKPNMNPNE